MRRASIVRIPNSRIRPRRPYSARASLISWAGRFLSVWSRAVSGCAVAVALVAAGCGGGGNGGGGNGNKPATPAQVTSAFAAEGIQLAVDQYATSREDGVAAFEIAKADDDLMVAVVDNEAKAKEMATQLAYLTGGTGSHPDIVRVENVIVAFGRNTPPKTKAAAERATRRLGE
jgi:hypothetical protein